MKIISNLLLAMIISGSQLLCQKIIVDKNNPRLQLPKVMKQVLESFEPQLECWQMKDYEEYISSTYEVNQHQLPWAIIGDFNNDGINDVVTDVHNTKLSLQLAILSKADNFYIVELNREEYVNPKKELQWSALYYIQKGTILSSQYEDSSLKLIADAFMISSEKGAAVYYFKDGEFIHYVTSD